MSDLKSEIQYLVSAILHKLFKKIRLPGSHDPGSLIFAFRIRRRRVWTKASKRETARQYFGFFV
jgi:hypothetical protein